MNYIFYSVKQKVEEKPLVIPLLKNKSSKFRIPADFDKEDADNEDLKKDKKKTLSGIPISGSNIDSQAAKEILEGLYYLDFHVSFRRRF